MYDTLIQDPSFWVFISFSIFLSMVFRPLSRYLKTFADSKRQKIEDDLLEAKGLKEEAQNLLAYAQQQKQEASEKWEEILRHAHEEAHRLKEKAEKEWQEYVRTEEIIFQDKISRMEQDMAQHIQNVLIHKAVQESEESFQSQDDITKKNQLDQSIDLLIRRLS